MFNPKKEEKKEEEKPALDSAKEIMKLVEEVNPKFKKPIWEHELIYDSSSETLEPIYFWLLDYMNDAQIESEKIVDNFSASPGSGYFAELGARATKMQEEGMKILGTVNTVIKSVINILYDMKEFEIRLQQYELVKSKKPYEKEAGLLALKQIWMDKVDLQKGRGSINAMTYELGFTTLRDAFMVAKSVEDVDRIDLNDRVRRVLKPRLAEFFEWKERSEKELRSRFEVEKSYLRGQVASLRLYTKWAKPYLKAAEELAMKERGRAPEMVKAFNTVILELCLFGKQSIDVQKAAELGNLPKSFRTLKLGRKYYSCILVDFMFRGIPSRLQSQQGGYMFGGRASIKFKAFALNEDEIKKFKGALEKSEFEESLKLVETVTGESLKQISDDIAHFLGEEAETGEKKKEKKAEKKGKEKEVEKPIRKDSFEESIVRKLAEQVAAANCFSVYDKYKKAHGMACTAEPEWDYSPRWRL